MGVCGGVLGVGVRKGGVVVCSQVMWLPIRWVSTVIRVLRGALC